MRVETEYVVIGYAFDMRTNGLMPEKAANPTAGKEHRFIAYRMKGAGGGTVGMKNAEEVLDELMDADDV